MSWNPGKGVMWGIKGCLVAVKSCCIAGCGDGGRRETPRGCAEKRSSEGNPFVFICCCFLFYLQILPSQDLGGVQHVCLKTPGRYLHALHLVMNLQRAERRACWSQCDFYSTKHALCHRRAVLTLGGEWWWCNTTPDGFLTSRVSVSLFRFPVFPPIHPALKCLMWPGPESHYGLLQS